MVSTAGSGLDGRCLLKDCRDVLKAAEPGSVKLLVFDPPHGTPPCGNPACRKGEACDCRRPETDARATGRLLGVEANRRLTLDVLRLGPRHHDGRSSPTILRHRPPPRHAHAAEQPALSATSRTSQ